MDSEHRHELKSNELVDLLTHFPQFLKKNANIIIGIALIVIGFVTWPIFSKMSRQKTIAEESRVSESIQLLGQDVMKVLQAYEKNPEQLNPSLDAILVNANALMNLTSKTDNPNLAALAYIKAAQAIRTELHLKNDIVSAETVDTQIQKAQDAYEKASSVAAIPTMKAMAGRLYLNRLLFPPLSTSHTSKLQDPLTADAIFSSNPTVNAASMMK